MNMKCEYCDIGHNGKYASGRFCSPKCSRGYSTSLNKKKPMPKFRLLLQKIKSIFALFANANSLEERKSIADSNVCVLIPI